MSRTRGSEDSAHILPRASIYSTSAFVLNSAKGSSAVCTETKGFILDDNIWRHTGLRTNARSWMLDAGRPHFKDRQSIVT